MQSSQYVQQSSFLDSSEEEIVEIENTSPPLSDDTPDKQVDTAKSDLEIDPYLENNDDLTIDIAPISQTKDLEVIHSPSHYDIEEELENSIENHEIVQPVVVGVQEEIPIEVIHPASEEHVDASSPNVYMIEKNEAEEIELDDLDQIDPNSQHLGTVVVPLQPKYPVEELVPFLTKLAASYQTYGAPANRVEYNMVLCSEAMGIYASYSSMPTSLTITFGSPDLAGSITRSLRLEQSLVECGKMYLLDRLIDKIAKEKYTLQEARDKLNEILKRPPHYHFLTKIGATAISSGAATGLFFGGNWIEIVVALLLGVFVGTIKHIGGKHRNFNRLADVLASLTASFIAAIIGDLIVNTCPTSIIMGSIVWLLPGISLTIAIRELATSNMASGTVRMFNACLTALKLGFGIAVGSQLPFWIERKNFETGCLNGLSHWWYILLFVLITVSFNVLLDTNTNLWPGMMLTSGISFVTSYVCRNVLNLPSDIIPSIAALFVGVAGNLISRFTDIPGVIFIFSGIMMLVPGSIGVQSVMRLLERDMQSGIEVGFQMIVVGLSITIGTFIANLIIVPKRSLVNRLY